MRRPDRSAWLVCAVVAIATACDDRVAPTPVPTPTPTPAGPAITRLRIEGRTALTAVGDSAQLEAIATLSDGAERNVTTTVRWLQDTTGTLTITAGLVTARELGRASVFAETSSPTGARVQATTKVTVTPPGTFVAEGRLREPGAGNIGDVQVTEVSTGQTRRSGNGVFVIGGLTNGDLQFTKAGYETANQVVAAGASPDVPMQKVLRLDAGGSVASILARNDVSYEVSPGMTCNVCRRVRLSLPSAGSVDLQLTWTDVKASLRLWINGQEFAPTSATPLRVDTAAMLPAGESWAYVGGDVSFVSYFGSHVDFVLRASSVR